jgi:hypothetical protein
MARSPLAMRLRAALAGALLLAIAGCASTKTGANDFQVTNKSDFFEFRVGTIDHFTMSQTYAWWNPDSAAVVRQESDIRDGAASVEIRDVDGLVVHSKNLNEKGTMATASGKPGMWSVKVTLDKATGSVGLQVRGR